MDDLPFLSGLNNVTSSIPELLPPEDLDLDRCQLLGPVALIVQGVMGLIIVCGLVIKRMREKPRRKWKIWLADVGKQVVGQFAVHLSNVAISDLIASTRSDNPCSLFALNILIDTSLGVLLIYFLLQYSTLLMQRYQPHYKTGYYGNPFSFSLWAEQAAVYVACLAVMKIVVLVIFWVAPELEDGMSWGISWIENEEAQVVVVMLILPLVMNLFQFLIVDSIIRSKDPASPGVFSENSDEESLRRGFLETASDDEDEDGNTERQRGSRRASATRSVDGGDYMDLGGGDEDENGKQKEATELLFDADSPMLKQTSSHRDEARHHYPPHTNSQSANLPPYSTLPPPGSVSGPIQPFRKQLDRYNDQGRRQESVLGEDEEEEEEDDGWGENWSASSDVEEDHLKPIPLQSKQPTSSILPEPLLPTTHSNASSPSLSASAESPSPLATVLPTAHPSPPTEFSSIPPKTTSSTSQSQTSESKLADEEEENDNDWGFDDSISSPIQSFASPLGPPPPHPDPLPELSVVPPESPLRNEQAEPTRPPSVEDEKTLDGDDEEDDWGFDDSLTMPASPIPPPVSDTTHAVEKALEVSETQLETQQVTVKAPSEVGKELGGLS